MIKKLLIALFISFSFLTCSFSDSGELQKVKINLFEGGENTYDSPDIVNVSQGTLLANAVNSRRGQLFKRKGQDLFANDLSNTAFTGLGSFYPDINTAYIVAASGPSIVRSNAAGDNWITINGANPLTTGKDTEFIQANKLLFMLNGQDYTANYSGSVWDPGSSSASSPPIVTTGAWLRNYLFVAGNSTQPDWIYFSNNLDPRTFTPTDIIKVNTGDGQRIVRLEPFKLNELIVYKERSIYNLDITGDILSGWTTQPISTTIGCIAPRTVVNVGNDHWFLSSDPIAVRSLARSQFDKILIDIASTPIQDLFNGTGTTVINNTYISKACAVLFDSKYFLAIPVGTSSVNNYVVVYDFITKSWTHITGWYPSNWKVFNNRLYYTDALDGRVVYCFTGNVGDMASGPVVTSASEPTVAISYEYATKNIDFDNAENYKQLDSIDMEFDPSGNYNATVYIELDNGGYQNIGTINLAGGGITLPENLPFILSASGVARKTFQLQRYGEFKKIKVKVIQNGTSELCNLHSITIFAKTKQWRREN